MPREGTRPQKKNDNLGINIYHINKIMLFSLIRFPIASSFAIKKSGNAFENDMRRPISRPGFVQAIYLDQSA